MSMPDYETRAKQYGFASPDEVKAALARPETVVLDVRSPAEIKDAGGLERSVQTDCTPESCPLLEASPEKFVKDKNATVVIFCRSGRRVVKAKETLLKKGYTGPILNAGGYSDIVKVI